MNLQWIENSEITHRTPLLHKIVNFNLKFNV